MSELEKNDYELVQMDEEARQELIEARRLDINEQFTTFNKRLFDKINSYLCDASNDVKTVLALNQLLGREFNQDLGYSLEGFEQIVNTIRDTTILANNNFIIPGTNVAEEYAIYVVVEPEVINLEEGAEYLSNNDKIKKATERLDADQTPYTLYLFINTDDYDIYAALEEDLRMSLGREFQLVSMFPNIETRALAEVTVDFFPPSSVASMVNSFLTTFGVFPHRRKKVYFDYDKNELGKNFTSLDFLLLAHSHLSNLVIKPETLQPLAQHFTNIWLGENSNYKHRYEEIEDFFYSPSVVLVKGLSPVYGVIVGREIVIKGSKLDYETEEESLVQVKINTEADISGLHYEDELTHYLKMNPENLRNKLIRCKDDVIRVDSLQKTLHIQGKNLNSDALSNKYTLTDDLSSLTFLTPFYRADYYNKLVNGIKGAVPYKLPERYKMYLLRLASYRGLEVPEVDSKWFSKANSSLTEVLSVLGDKFHLDTILGYSISPLDGILNKKILVSLEALKCLTREN